MITKWILNFAARPRSRRSVSVLPLQTTGATDWEFFRVHNEFFLVVANAYNYGPQAAELSERYKTNSTIYRLNKQRKQFEKYQDIVTYRYGMRVADIYEACACARAWVRGCVRACVCAWACVYVSACVCTCARASAHLFIPKVSFRAFG